MSEEVKETAPQTEAKEETIAEAETMQEANEAEKEETAGKKKHFGKKDKEIEALKEEIAREELGMVNPGEKVFYNVSD